MWTPILEEKLRETDGIGFFVRILKTHDMTHFVVLIIVPINIYLRDIESRMAPYYEECQVDPYIYLTREQFG